MGDPLVSVIMPVRNEGAFIERSLGAVLAQDWPEGKLEVIVADGMSTDGTPSILERMAGKHSNLRVINNPAGIVAPGLNRAVSESMGDVIVRVDGHTLIGQDYVAACVDALERTGADNVGGTMTAEGDGWVAQAVATATSHPFGVGGARFHWSAKEEWVDTVYLGCWRKGTLGQMGPFDEELVRNQDDELNYRLRSLGGQILLSPAIKSTYHCRSGLRSLWRQYFEYGFWKVRVMQKHPRQMQPRQLIPALFVLGLAGSLIASFLLPVFWAAFGIILGSYLAANVAASVALATRRGWALLPLLPVVFGVLHVAYGSGFLWGLLRFSRRWGDRTTLADGERLEIVPKV